MIFIFYLFICISINASFIYNLINYVDDNS